MDNGSIYQTEVSIKGGSHAQLRSPDGTIDLELRLPQALGGPGGATNAEQLFASAYAACLSSALSAAALEQNVKLPAEPEIRSEIQLGRSDSGTYSMTCTLDVSLPGLDAMTAGTLITRAREIWPWRSPEAVSLAVKMRR